MFNTVECQGEKPAQPAPVQYVRCHIYPEGYGVFSSVKSPVTLSRVPVAGFGNVNKVGGKEGEALGRFGCWLVEEPRQISHPVHHPGLLVPAIGVHSPFRLVDSGRRARRKNEK